MATCACCPALLAVPPGLICSSCRLLAGIAGVDASGPVSFNTTTTTNATTNATATTTKLLSVPLTALYDGARVYQQGVTIDRNDSGTGAINTYLQVGCCMHAAGGMAAWLSAHTHR